MLSYELILQLHAFGFQLREVPTDPLVRGHWEVAHRIDGRDYFDPTLSELIAACGDRFNCVARISDGMLAGAFLATSVKIDDKPYAANGSTPEEAVANLWLALNKK